MSDELNPKHGFPVAIGFSKANMTTGESNTDLLRGTGGTLWTAPKAGSIVGLEITASAAITAGTITAKPHAASTEYADVGVPAPACSSAAQGSYAVARARAIRFAAGDKIGVSVTTTTTLDPTDSLDVGASLLVVLDYD